MATYTPGGDALQWLAEEWQPGLAVAPYEESRILSTFRDVGKIPYKYHIPQHAAVTAQQLAEGAPGSSLAAAGTTEIKRTITCATYYVMIEVNKNVAPRMAGNPQDPLRRSCEMAVSAKMDAVCGTILDDVTGATAAGAVLDYADVRYAHWYLAMNAKEWFDPRNHNGVLVLHPTALHALHGLTTVGTILDYQVRGPEGGNNPIIKGWVGRILGFDVVETGSVSGVETASNHSNCAYIPNKTFVTGAAQRPTPLIQEFLLVDRIICWVDFGVTCEWPATGCELLTLSTDPTP
jgi:hypothetical protein